jgi:bifunctional DNA-binding transcriptional regulator/antitoxin component of YhaV-PrlF toxin-antitoxin module
MKDDFSIAFVATVDSKGRLRIPKKQRDAKRIVAGMDFEVKIWQIEKEQKT